MRMLKIFITTDGLISVQNARIMFVLYREINESWCVSKLMNDSVHMQKRNNFLVIVADSIYAQLMFSFPVKVYLSYFPKTHVCLYATAVHTFSS